MLDTAKAAAKIASKQAEKTKLNTITLPATFQALGRHCYTSGSFRNEFADLFGQLDSIRKQIEELSSQGSNPQAATTFVEKTKAAANKAVQVAQGKKLSMHQSSLLTRMGKDVFAKHQDQSGPENIVGPISTALAQIAQLDSEMASLSQTGNGSWITPRRLLIAGAVMILFVIGGIVSRQAGSNSQTGGVKQLVLATTGKPTGKLSPPEQREKNKREAVVASSLTKKEFIEKLRSKMAKDGCSIDDSHQVAHFYNFAFQDTFGDPDSNVEFTGSKRLITYQCQDGSLQLTVTYMDRGGSMVFLEGINQY